MEFSVPIAVLAFACELVDSSLGMGYGTTLTPLLLLLGYTPVQVVPAVLMSECVTGILAGLAHQEFGNVDLRPHTRDFRVTLVLTGFSLVGVLLGVGIAVNIPSWAVKVYVGVLVLVIGLNTLRNHGREIPFSWRRIGGLGLVAAFNKGISGGGYGPVVTGGQVLSGIEGRSAVAIASLAEGITSAVGVVAYLCSGAPVPWDLAPSLLLGATLSVPISAYVVSRLPARRLTLLIGGLSTSLGAYTLARLVLPAM
ncbi:MAG: sulfite exporter TauE/SafE family protein [Chloroflexota bacterium]|nr:sulfite exporter TauE/SafE family protein [Chloroflexota bacterium]